MKPSRALFPLPESRWSVQITDDRSRTLIDPARGVAFHSASGGLAETTHVYLENSGVAERLRSRQPCNVLEIGLGVGMGLLVTLDAAITHSCPLHYVAIENDWLPGDVLRTLNFEELLSQPSLAESFYQWRDSFGSMVPAGEHRRMFGPSQQVIVHHLDALLWTPAPEQRFDAIYFDPFAPEINPELWSSSFLSRLQRLLGPHGRLVTYCVNRQVRETLCAAGFIPQKVPGPPGGKREVMVARKEGGRVKSEE